MSPHVMHPPAMSCNLPATLQSGNNLRPKAFSKVVLRRGAAQAACRPASGAAMRKHVITCVASPPEPTAAAAAASDVPTKIASNGLPRSAVVGVLGGGQLGKMLAQEAVSAAWLAAPALTASSVSRVCLDTHLAGV